MSRAATVLGALGLALAATLPLALAFGHTAMSFTQLWDAARGEGGDVLVRVLWDIRAPRVALGALVGAALGGCGAALQEWLDNPLVEPGLGGVSSGASLGAVAAIYSGLASAAGLPLVACAMAGALLATLFVSWMAGGEAGTQRVLLAGLVVSSACNAGVGLVLNLSSNPMANLELSSWLLGSLADRSVLHLQAVALPIALGLGLLVYSGRELRTWALGAEAAESLGVSPRALQRRVLVGSALAVGAAVSVSGVIGFVGLFVPHLLRRAVKGDAALLIPASSLAGAVLLVWADACVRASAPLLQGSELKLGVVTALLGTPLLLRYARRARQEFSR